MLGTLQSTCHQAFLQEVAGLACHAGLDWQLAESTWCSLQPGSQGMLGCAGLHTMSAAMS